MRETASPGLSTPVPDHGVPSWHPPMRPYNPLPGQTPQTLGHVSLGTRIPDTQPEAAGETKKGRRGGGCCWYDWDGLPVPRDLTLGRSALRAQHVALCPNPCSKSRNGEPQVSLGQLTGPWGGERLSCFGTASQLSVPASSLPITFAFLTSGLPRTHHQHTPTPLPLKGA